MAITRSDPQQRPEVRAGEEVNAFVSFAGKLDAGEALSGTPTVVEVVTSDLTFSSVAVTSATETINNEAVSAGEAIGFHVVGQKLTGSPYELVVSVATDAGQTRIVHVLLRVVG